MTEVRIAVGTRQEDVEGEPCHLGAQVYCYSHVCVPLGCSNYLNCPGLESALPGLICSHR